MNKNLTKAVAAAVLAMGASAANAGITIPAGDWTIDIGGNVNAYYTNTNFSGDAAQGGKLDTVNEVSTGLLPSALGIGGKTRQNDLDIAFQFTFFVGAGANGGLGGQGALSGEGSAAGSNTLNIRQAFATFGDKSWGSIKFGRDLGIFGSDAILSDMTLLGVGVGAGSSGSSTLGRIGSGYVYADWVGQISYASPNWNGFSFNVGMREPWANGNANENKNNLGFEGKVSYDWAGDFSGKVWAEYLTQKHEGQNGAVGFDNYTSHGYGIGGKVAVAGFGLVGYYYDGKGLDGQLFGVANQVGGLQFLSGNKSDDSGGYIQGTYTIAAANNLKLGVSWGESNSQNDVNGTGDIKNESWIVGAYYPITKSLNLVAEYTDQKVKDDDAISSANELKARTMSLGAILFF
jgi:predicted porin